MAICHLLIILCLLKAQIQSEFIIIQDQIILRIFLTPNNCKTCCRGIIIILMQMLFKIQLRLVVVGYDCKNRILKLTESGGRENSVNIASVNGIMNAMHGF